ncbi:MAG TPA: hypothetical protein VM533_17215 [Fimbriiglobus sp.]|jgi:hypothetical protein|nr:hypothetical protein [Fimbriiglobus sp.]
MNTQDHAPGRPAAAELGVIEVRLREVRQLFDAMDPSPFREKDLDSKAEEYIVESVKELPSRSPCALVIHLDRPTGLPDEARCIGDAVRVHFTRQSDRLRRDLHRLIRRGFLSLGIGVGFLAALFAAAQLVSRLMGDDGVAALLREGLIIGGWVAMWRPLEIFLYDWWPIVGERRIHDRLSRIDVQVVPGNAGTRDDLTRILTGSDPGSGHTARTAGRGGIW